MTTSPLRLTVICLLLLPHAAVSAAQTRRPAAGRRVAAPKAAPAAPKQYRNLKLQAEEVVRALPAGDFARLVDLTHPKVVRMAGGREKMIASLARQMKEDEARGVRYGSVSVSVGEPDEIVSVGKQLFAVVPFKMKREAAPRGVLVMESFVLGVSDDGRDNWKFLNVESKAHLKFMFPAAANKLRIPEEKPPAFEPAP